MAKPKENLKKQVKELTEELLSIIGIEASVSAEEESARESEEQTIQVYIGAHKQAGLLIGAQGATLNAMQSFLAMTMRQKKGKWIRILLDIADWRQKHEEHLESLAQQASERALSTGEPQHLYNLSPAQRRVVHMSLSKEKKISTESVGEGESRYLVVKPE